MIYKGKDLRIYKIILKVGEKSLDKTAPIDFIDFVFTQDDVENR